MRSHSLKKVVRLVSLMAVGVMLSAVAAFADHEHVTGPFQGVKANTGRAIHTKVDGRHVLTVSEDFKVPDAPAPHWQVVDSRGNVYLLQRLDIKGGKFNRQITLPPYIQDIAKVQIWCAWAEVLLGEASFADPVK
jgi:hypothetical protein